MLVTPAPADAPVQFFQHLVDGDETACHGLLDRLRAEHGASVLTLCEVITKAFHQIGDAWECSELDVYREHVASQIGYRLLLSLRSMLSTPDKNAPKAIGCTPPNDPYTLPTVMVELVLRELGFQAQSLGTNLPLKLLVPAIKDVRPHLCWVSVSSNNSAGALRKELLRLSDIGRIQGVRIVCGGRAIDDELKNRISDVTFLNDLRELHEFSTANIKN